MQDITEVVNVIKRCGREDFTFIIKQIYIMKLTISVE